MRYKIHSSKDLHPYEISRIELIADNEQERIEILSVSELIENFLTLTLNTIEVIDSNPPFFTVKRNKPNLGMG